MFLNRAEKKVVVKRTLRELLSEQSAIFTRKRPSKIKRIYCPPNSLPKNQRIKDENHVQRRKIP